MWFAWVLIVLHVLGALATVYLVGRPRGPLTPGSAALTVFVQVLLVLGIVFFIL